LGTQQLHHLIQAGDRPQPSHLKGNILETRKREVWIVTANEQTKIEMEAEALKSGCEIEERLITALLERASAFWNKS